MKIEYLREFVDLAQCLNFRATAERHFVSQSVISRHIQTLEEELGARLLTRDTQKVVLTPIGEFFFSRIQGIIREYDALCGEVELRCEGFEGTLRVGFPHYCMPDYLGQAPSRFLRLQRNTLLSYFAGTPNQCLTSLLRREVDNIIIARMPYKEEEYLVFHNLYKEPFIVLLPPSHPLLERGGVMLEELRGETFITVDSPFFNAMWPLVTEMCAKRGFVPKGPVKCRQTEGAFVAVQQGKGVYIAGWHARIHASSALRYVPILDSDCFRNIALAYAAGAPPHPATGAFIRAFEDIGPYGWKDSTPPWLN